MSLYLTDRIDIIPTDQIVPFEWSTEDNSEVQPVAQTGAVVNHPFMVAPLESGEYLLLNQSDLFYQLQSYGLNYLPVQISQVDKLAITAEPLNVSGLTLPRVESLVQKNAEQMALGDPGSRAPFPESISLELAFNDAADRLLHIRNSTRLGCPAPLARLFEEICREGRYVPEIDCTGLEGTPFRASQPDFVLTLPEFTGRDLVTAAQSDRPFPPNCLRVSDGLRILNLDFPINILKTDLPLSELQMFLRDLLAYREQARRTSYIEGRVYILNR